MRYFDAATSAAPFHLTELQRIRINNLSIHAEKASILTGTVWLLIPSSDKNATCKLIISSRRNGRKRTKRERKVCIPRLVEVLNHFYPRGNNGRAVRGNNCNERNT